MWSPHDANILPAYFVFPLPLLFPSPDYVNLFLPSVIIFFLVFLPSAEITLHTTISSDDDGFPIDLAFYPLPKLAWLYIYHLMTTMVFLLIWLFSSTQACFLGLPSDGEMVLYYLFYTIFVYIILRCHTFVSFKKAVIGLFFLSQRTFTQKLPRGATGLRLVLLICYH